MQACMSNGGPTVAQNAFRQTLARLTADIAAHLAGRPLDSELGRWLNAEHGADSSTWQTLKQQCLTGVEQGWLCEREGGGIRYGRVFKPAADLHGFSVDVVDMHDIAGPHHSHPLGEIDLIMPLDGEAQFDGHPAGWLVYPPGSAHRPSNGSRPRRIRSTWMPSIRPPSPGSGATTTTSAVREGLGYDEVSAWALMRR